MVQTSQPKKKCHRPPVKKKYWDGKEKVPLSPDQFWITKGLGFGNLKKEGELSETERGRYVASLRTNYVGPCQWKGRKEWVMDLFPRNPTSSKLYLLNIRPLVGISLLERSVCMRSDSFQPLSHRPSLVSTQIPKANRRHTALKDSLICQWKSCLWFPLILSRIWRIKRNDYWTSFGLHVTLCGIGRLNSRRYR